MASRGELEHRVMVLLWGAKRPLSVADVQEMLAPQRELAYTTVMTVLDRLAKKGLASRHRVGRSWRYEAAEPQAVVLARELGEVVAGLPEPVLAETLRLFNASLQRP
ncbi:MAG: BlaI/MecI/CopY family transcriptional regulator [Arachnia propionica]|uniref:BlaI/MecI/CopY family transcriptional regulator n=1 Tax=Arachnia propionica TaxID=1750 RepID=UPI00270DD336|nr:BlaI/MecI/CopY family transcriptional regulator [Arachnia propionica]